MKTAAMIGIAALLGGLLGAGASELISSKRIQAVNAHDKPAVVLQADDSGAGELIILDGNGKELWAVRKGVIIDHRATTAQAAPASPAASGVRIMQIESIETQQADIDRDAIEDLRAQAAEKNARADKLEDERRDLDLDPNTHDSKENRARSAAEARRHWQQLGEDITKLRSEADKLEGQAKRLERDAGTPRQMIRGWNGSQTVVLKTTVDCARTLSSLAHGAFITWEGTIMDHDPDMQVWTVTKIASTAKPASFNPRGDH